MRAGIIVLLACVVVAGFWGGTLAVRAGELHHRSCVNAAKAKGYDGSPLDLKIDRATGHTDATRTASELARSCSRLPW